MGGGSIRTKYCVYLKREAMVYLARRFGYWKMSSISKGLSRTKYCVYLEIVSENPTVIRLPAKAL